MQISTEEVNRLLAATPSERSQRTNSPTLSKGNTTTDGREAAHVEISTSAQDLQKYKKLIAELPDVREDRVQALKAQIEAGAYHVSGQDIADLIIRRTLADNTAP